MKVRERYIAMMFLKKANRGKSGGLWTSLKNNYSRGTKQYPKTLSEVYSMMCSHTPEHRDGKRNSGFSNRTQPGGGQDVKPTELSFLQQDVVAGTNGNVFPNITCFKCKKKGHYASVCPSAESVGFNALQIKDGGGGDDEIHFMFTQLRKHVPDT